MKLDDGTYDGRTLINPSTNEIYIIGGYHKDAIDVEIFDPDTESVKPHKPRFDKYYGGSSNEIYDNLILSIGGYDTETYDGFDLIQYAFLPQIPS